MDNNNQGGAVIDSKADGQKAPIRVRCNHSTFSKRSTIIKKQGDPTVRASGLFIESPML